MADGIKEAPEDGLLNEGAQQPTDREPSGRDHTDDEHVAEANDDEGRASTTSPPDGTELDEQPPARQPRAESRDGSTDAEPASGGSATGSDKPLETEGEVAADYLEELLDVADLDGDIDTYVENDRAQVSVITNSTQLIGDDGEVLEALQELTRLAVASETGERSRLMLDVGGYRENRRRKLTELAADVIEEVRTSGEPVRLDPMNPFERKLVHDAVAEAGLTSESDGMEPERRVVVHPGP